MSADCQLAKQFANKAKKLLKWSPKRSIQHLIKEMMDSDLKLIKKIYISQN